MRLSTVRFEKYGPFTGKELCFDPKAKLHLVYGPNASGKSCALAGITDLFFGIEQQTRFNFLHESKQLLLAAALTSKDGSELTFRRRKGTKDVLTSADGAALADGAVLAKLGGNLTRNVFRHAFGLDSEQLRAGAKEMLDSEGEVGVSMYAAASGLAGITRLRRSLDEEAGNIFKPGKGSQKRRFDQAAAAYTTARQEIGQRSVKAEKLRAQRESADTARKNLQAARDVRTRARAEHARLSRLQTLSPLIQNLDRERAIASNFERVPVLTEAATEKLRSLQKRAEKDASAEEDAQRELERARVALSGTSDAPEWVQLQASVKALQTNVGKYKEDVKDKSRVSGEAEATRLEIVELGRRVGLSEDRLIENQPTDAAVAALTALIAEGEALQRKGDGLTGTIEELERKLDELTPSEGATPVADPATWQARFAALMKVRPLLQQEQQLTRTTTQRRRRLEERRVRMRPPAPSMEDLATCALPSEPSVTALSGRLASAEERFYKAEGSLSDAKAELLLTEGELASVVAGAPLVSAERILASRHSRNQSWQSLRSVLLGEIGVSGENMRPAVELHEMRVADADTLSDRATHDAARIERHRALDAAAQHLRRQIEVAEQELGLSASVLRDAKDEWAELWAALTDNAGRPVEMLAWATELRAVLGDREELLTELNELASLQEPLEALHSGLLDLNNELGLAVPLASHLMH